MSTEIPSSSSHDTEHNRLKEIEINRIKAKSRIRAEAEARNAQSSNNTNGKRPLGVITGDSDSATKKPANPKDANTPLKRDTRLMGAPLFGPLY
jgi:hypothetical protein